MVILSADVGGLVRWYSIVVLLTVYVVAFKVECKRHGLAYPGSVTLVVIGDATERRQASYANSRRFRILLKVGSAEILCSLAEMMF